MRKFAIFYTLGNLISIAGTVFLSGLKAQWKRITSYGRLPTVIIFFLAMGTTLYAAFAVENERLQRLLLLIGMVVQFCAFFWYNLSFIPFGRSIFKSMCKKCFTEGD